MLYDLKHEVCQANKDIQRLSLAPMTWGNVSGYDPDTGVVVIKPSGVPYEELTAELLTVVDLDGQVVEGELNPSSDTPTHLYLYRNFEEVHSVVHTHSLYATMFCQAQRELPCMGTSHADHFSGAVPVTRILTEEEVKSDYVSNTGKVILEALEGRDPLSMPAALVASHAPFTWGRTPREALENAIALETVARMAVGTFLINPAAGPTPDYLLEKHFMRKHGPGATYGQAPELPRIETISAR